MGDDGVAEARLEVWRRGVVSDGVAVVADAIVLCSGARGTPLVAPIGTGNLYGGSQRGFGRVFTKCAFSTWLVLPQLCSYHLNSKAPREQRSRAMT